MNTIQEAAAMALAAQSACNLSGVVHSMSQAVTLLWEKALADGEGTTWVNNHPIMVLFAVQVAHLTRVTAIASEACEYSRCYRECEVLAGRVAA